MFVSLERVGTHEISFYRRLEDEGMLSDDKGNMLLLFQM
jgi:hypothetical protein